ncbi:restriction endonuclease subunit S [Archangium gephyra]|uniref:restriction endonuclease subunit S n=1 Tax=Archangium gephyra TaxID=48 RepID=UPI003B80C832
MSALPLGWAIFPLETLVAPEAPIMYGIVQPGPDIPDGVPYVRPTEIENNEIVLNNLRRTTPEIAARYARASLAYRDVLLSIVGTIGKVTLVPPQLAGGNITQSSARVRANDAVEPEWLAWFLRSPSARKQFKEAQLGTGVPRLNIAHVRALEVPLAPLDEQRRIVAKLDTLFARSRAAKASLERVPALLERLRQAVLAATFRGDLSVRTASDRADLPEPDLFQKFSPTTREFLQSKGVILHKLPAGWSWTTLGSLATEVRNGLGIKPEDAPPGIPILRISAIRPFEVRHEETRFLRAEADIDAYGLRTGDLLFTRYNGSLDLVGVGAMIRDVQAPLVYPDKLIRVRLREGVPPAYVEAACATPTARQFIESCAKSTSGQTGISGAELKMVPIPLAPPHERELIVKGLEMFRQYERSTLNAALGALEKVTALDRSTLAAAFRGQLVPQDPNDEPASVLLERIRAEREAPPPVKSKRGANTATPAKARTSKRAP